MRLKEIEARLAEIKEELNTRAAELTDEEITKLETEVTDLQEERTALLAAAEKRKSCLKELQQESRQVEREQIPRCLEISREQAAQEQENQRTNTTLWHTEKRL